MGDDYYLALKVMMMPKDCNTLPPISDRPTDPARLTIFGGVILSYIDQAGAIGAWHAVVKAGGPLPNLVTVAFNRVEFRRPVLVGDVVSFGTKVERIGRTSITMQVRVEAERKGDIQHVTEAEVVYVGVDLSTAERHPVPLLP